MSDITTSKDYYVDFNILTTVYITAHIRKNIVNKILKINKYEALKIIFLLCPSNLIWIANLTLFPFIENKKNNFETDIHTKEIDVLNVIHVLIVLNTHKNTVYTNFVCTVSNSNIKEIHVHNFVIK